jgi:hypothetical protein
MDFNNSDFVKNLKFVAVGIFVWPFYDFVDFKSAIF